MKHIYSTIYQEESMHDTAKDAEKIGAKLGEGGLVAIKAELIRLAAQMVRATSMPDIESWTWPARVPGRLWVQARDSEDAAREQCIQWAMSIKEIADGLPAVLKVPEGWQLVPVEATEKIGAKLLRWHSDGDEVSASSRCHDDGTAFVYRFERVRGGWRNCSDLELCNPRTERFLRIDDAMSWAAQCEQAWIAEFANV